MKSFNKSWWILWLIISISLLMINASVVLLNSVQIEILNENKEQILIMKKSVDELQNSTIHGLDLGIRGYALSMKKGLLSPFENAIYYNNKIFANLYNQAEIFQYPRKNIDSLNVLISRYIDLTQYLKKLIQEDSLAKFKEILSTDPGLAAWRTYNYYEEDIFQHLTNARNNLNRNIESRLMTNFVLQLLIILFIIPSIIIIFITLNKLKKNIGQHNDLVMQKNSELENSKEFMSHIIRGPICRLRGLLYLFSREEKEEKKEVLKKIELMVIEIDNLTKQNSG